MLAPDNTIIASGSCPPHSYATRIRSNSHIKPPAHLGQPLETPLPPPPAPLPARKIRPNAPLHTISASASTTRASPPLPADTPEFPPPHVTLHPDDATSKVFLAIGRSFLSVDNRAMTIKDLAEMTLKFGLHCPNASAAGQAITTYIRVHTQRCDAEQDHPLLSKHVLSGTPSDDELLPALHSRTGGAHCALNPGDARTTNFRRGTIVWFLSRAAGAPCPFARAGIRLAEYTENGRIGGTVPDNPRERKRERDRRRRALASAQLCGTKRKRLARGCKPDNGADTEEEEPDPRPPKVKLTLRLRPSLVHTPASASSSAASVAPSTSASLAPVPASSATAPPSARGASELVDQDYAIGSGSDDDDDMSVDEDSDSDDSDSDEGHYIDSSTTTLFCMPSPSAFARSRESSVAATPPPDSDEDVSYVYEDDDVFEWSEDEEAPAPAPAPVADTAGVRIKQEEDEDAIGRLLSQWESHDLQQITQAVVAGVTAAASLSLSVPARAPSPEVYIKREEPDWDLSLSAFSAPPPPVAEAPEPIEVEDEWEDSVVFSPIDEAPDMHWGSSSASSTLGDAPSLSSTAPGRRFSEPFPPPRASAGRRMSELLWRDAEIRGLESISAKELDEGEWAPATPATALPPVTATPLSLPSLAMRQSTPPPPHPTNVFPPTPTTATFASSSSPPLFSPTNAPSPSAVSDATQDEAESGPRTPPPAPHANLPAIWSASPVPFGFGNRHFAPAKGAGADLGPSPYSNVDVEGDARMEDTAAELLRHVHVAPLPVPGGGEDDAPLSPTEEAMFAQLCALPEDEAGCEVMAVGEMDEGEGEEEGADVSEVERPLELRRSRRVAAAQQEAAKKTRGAGAGAGAKKKGRKRAA